MNSLHFAPDISKTVGDSRFFSYWEPIGKWPWAVERWYHRCSH